MKNYNEMSVSELQLQKKLLEAELLVKTSAFKAKSKEEASKMIAEKTTKAIDLIRECEEIAKLNDTAFKFSVSYGMGGSFRKGYEYDDHRDDKEWGWTSSSQDC